MSTTSNKEIMQRLNVVMKLAENQTCCDCGDVKPTWASIIVPPPGTDKNAAPMGGLCCFHCSGAHRRLGVHICFVRSLTLDEWKEKELIAMEIGGNKRVNDAFEAKIVGNCDIPKPDSKSNLEVRDKFIRAKYQERRYLDPEKYVSGLPTTRVPHNGNGNFGNPFEGMSQTDLFSLSKGDMFASLGDFPKLASISSDGTNDSKMNIFLQANCLDLLESSAGLFGGGSQGTDRCVEGLPLAKEKLRNSTAKEDECVETIVPIKSSDGERPKRNSASKRGESRSKSRSPEGGERPKRRSPLAEDESVEISVPLKSGDDGKRPQRRSSKRRGASRSRSQSPEEKPRSGRRPPLGEGGSKETTVPLKSADNDRTPKTSNQRREGSRSRSRSPGGETPRRSSAVAEDCEETILPLKSSEGERTPRRSGQRRSSSSSRSRSPEGGEKSGRRHSKPSSPRLRNSSSSDSLKPSSHRLRNSSSSDSLKPSSHRLRNSSSSESWKSSRRPRKSASPVPPSSAGLKNERLVRELFGELKAQTSKERHKESTDINEEPQGSPDPADKRRQNPVPDRKKRQLESRRASTSPVPNSLDVRSEHRSQLSEADDFYLRSVHTCNEALGLKDIPGETRKVRRPSDDQVRLSRAPRRTLGRNKASDLAGCSSGKKSSTIESTSNPEVVDSKSVDTDQETHGVIEGAGENTSGRRSSTAQERVSRTTNRVLSRTKSFDDTDAHVLGSRDMRDRKDAPPNRRIRSSSVGRAPDDDSQSENIPRRKGTRPRKAPASKSPRRTQSFVNDCKTSLVSQ